MRELWRRIDALLRRRPLERDLDEELSFHLDMKAREVGDRAAARRALGSLLLLRECAREAWGWRWLDDVLWDVQYALRILRQNPGFTAVAITMLAVGIGVNAAVFTVTNAVLFKGLSSVEQSDRLLFIGEDLSYPDFEDWRTQTTSFERVGALSNTTLVLSDTNGFPESHTATQVSADFFRVLRKQPIFGRDFVASDETLGAAPVAILSYGLWEQRYGKDPSVIGRMVRLNGIPTTVVGVMPRGFTFPQEQALWLPLRPTPEFQRRDARRIWFAIGRLRDSPTVESARAETDVIWRRLASAHPHSGAIPTYGYAADPSLVPLVLTFQQFFIDGNRSTNLRAAMTTYGSLWAAVGLVLLIACANLANLLLARATGRSREISVRIALGAGRWRIIRQLLVESVMLSGVGGVLGWWLARWGVHAYEVFVTPPVSLWDWHQLVDYSMDNRALGYLVAISIGTGCLFGLAPALRLSRLDVHGGLKDGGSGATGGRRGKHLAGVLVIGEMALAVVLLAGAGVMIRSFLNVYTDDLGFNPAHQLVGFLNLPNPQYAHADAQLSFYDRLRARMEALPGVESIAFVDALPRQRLARIPYEVAGVPAVEVRHRPIVSTLVISQAYFRTLGAAILAGRDFTNADGGAGPPVSIVNQQFANTHWPGEDPVGKRLRLFAGATSAEWLTVVGLASNVAQSSAIRQFDPVVYVPYRQRPTGGMWVIVRTRVPPATIGAAFRHEVQALDEDLAVWNGPATLSDRMAYVYWNRGVNGVLFLIFAVIALLLAAIGLYSVVAHAVSQRTQEIGIRTAVGATSRDILRLVFKQGMLPVGVGLTIGLAAALAVTPLLKFQLVEVSPVDPITLVVASATLIVSAAVGCWIPARRAIRVDPVVALRHG